MKISVCMAAYNGERYIEEQILSILNQSKDVDELLIVNDCSTDNTLKIICNLNNSRIKIINNETNIGVTKTFEKAIYHASGDIIFLSDQDDIWMPTKVEKVVKFMTDRKVDAVVTDAIIVHENGEVLNKSFFEFRKSGPGLLKNFYKNSYIGCCMAIDSKLKKYILPFPDYIEIHDEWIGIVSNFIGNIEFLPEKLIKYRRHSENQTNLYRSNLIRVIKKRIKWLRIFSVELTRIWFISRQP
jgi:glycosyltransferase involved in cell wall biosynthesis